VRSAGEGHNPPRLPKVVRVLWISGGNERKRKRPFRIVREHRKEGGEKGKI